MAIMLPVLIWPLVFYTTLFLFDNPQNLSLTFLLFFAINAYPLYLLIVVYFNSLLFAKNKLIGLILPCLVVATLLYGAIWIFIENSRNFDQSVKRENERKQHGYIDANNNFKIIDNKVYYKDTVVLGADANTFEILSWNWERDKTYYYYFGKRIDYIDRASFQDLDYHYGKDKFHAYYDEKIIEGADAKSFIHIEGTQEARDAMNCYSWGEEIDCKLLPIKN